jgi:hypothetical protein
MHHLGRCVGFWGDCTSTEAGSVRIAPQPRLKRLERWRSRGLVIRYQSLVFRCRSDRTVGAVARSNGKVGVLERSDCCHSWSGGGLAFLRHTRTSQHHTFLKTGRVWEGLARSER